MRAVEGEDDERRGRRGEPERSGATVPDAVGPREAPGAGQAPRGLMSLLVGAPAGAHARERTARWPGPRRGAFAVPAWRSVAAVAALCAAARVAGGLLQKRYCFVHGWGGSDVFWHACFSELPRLWATSPLSAGSLPYADPGGFDLPVGTGVVLWLLSLVVPPGAGSQQAFTAAWAVAAAVCAVATVLLVATTSRRHPQRALLFGVSPLLLTVGLVSPELVSVVLVAFALWAWAREQPVLAGVAFGAAAVSRTYALLVLAAVGLVALRAGVARVWCRTAGVALVFAAVALLAVEVTTGGAVSPYLAWLARAPDYGSVVYLATLAGHPVPTATATVLAAAGWALSVLVGSLFALLPRRRPAVAEVALVMLVVVFLTGKSVPVQASLWLLPLVALAGVSWWTYAAWSAAEVLYFVAVWLYIGGAADPNRALPAAWFALFLVLRLGAMVALALEVVDRALHRPAARLGVTGDAPADAQTAAVAEDSDDAAGPAAGRRDALVVVAAD